MTPTIGVKKSHRREITMTKQKTQEEKQRDLFEVKGLVKQREPELFQLLADVDNGRGGFNRSLHETCTPTRKADSARGFNSFGRFSSIDEKILGLIESGNFTHVHEMDFGRRNQMGRVVFITVGGILNEMSRDFKPLIPQLKKELVKIQEARDAFEHSELKASRWTVITGETEARFNWSLGRFVDNWIRSMVARNTVDTVEVEAALKRISVARKLTKKIDAQRDASVISTTLSSVQDILFWKSQIESDVFEMHNISAEGM